MGKREAVRFAGRVLTLAAACGLPAREALAFLQTGTLLTNAASATYMAGSQGTSVTYSATAKILVANPAVNIWKTVTPLTVGSAGGFVTYQICFSNGGANTAFNLTVNDRLPNNSYWVATSTADLPDYEAWAIQISGGSSIQASWGSTFPPLTPGIPPAGTGSPIFMRWTTPNLGIGRSGCITFTVSLG
jgi:uncharacterized repeat protein (TIGR01451 family)